MTLPPFSVVSASPRDAVAGRRELAMRNRTRWIIVAVAATVAAGVGGGIAAASGGADHNSPIVGPDRARAEAAALAYVGDGRVTETEVGDEESFYEVEVTLPDGRQIDVQLDENFNVVGSSTDEQPGDEGADENDGDDGEE
jgi:hypothetical protein